MCTALWRKYDDGDDDWEEGTEVSSDEDTFSKRQVLRPKNVECGHAKDGGENEQSCLPSCRDIALSVVDNNQALDNEADKPAIERHDTLPRDGGEPTCQSVSKSKRRFRHKTYRTSN